MKSVIAGIIIVLSIVGLWAVAALPTTVNDLPQAALSKCDMGKITWRDAYIKTKAGGLDPHNIDSTLPIVISYGCIAQTEKAVLIIHSFVNGQPDDFLVVPKGWVDELIMLKDKGEEPSGTEEEISDPVPSDEIFPVKVSTKLENIDAYGDRE